MTTTTVNTIHITPLDGLATDQEGNPLTWHYLDERTPTSRDRIGTIVPMCNGQRAFGMARFKGLRVARMTPEFRVHRGAVCSPPSPHVWATWGAGILAAERMSRAATDFLLAEHPEVFEELDSAQVLAALRLEVIERMDQAMGGVGDAIQRYREAGGEVESLRGGMRKRFEELLLDAFGPEGSSDRAPEPLQAPVPEFMESKTMTISTTHPITVPMSQPCEVIA